MFRNKGAIVKLCDDLVNYKDCPNELRNIMKIFTSIYPVNNFCCLEGTRAITKAGIFQICENMFGYNSVTVDHPNTDYMADFIGFIPLTYKNIIHCNLANQALLVKMAKSMRKIIELAKKFCFMDEVTTDSICSFFRCLEKFRDHDTLNIDEVVFSLFDDGYIFIVSALVGMHHKDIEINERLLGQWVPFIFKMAFGKYEHRFGKKSICKEIRPVLQSFSTYLQRKSMDEVSVFITTLLTLLAQHGDKRDYKVLTKYQFVKKITLLNFGKQSEEFTHLKASRNLLMRFCYELMMSAGCPEIVEGTIYTIKVTVTKPKEYFDPKELRPVLPYLSGMLANKLDVDGMPIVMNTLHIISFVMQCDKLTDSLFKEIIHLGILESMMKLLENHDKNRCVENEGVVNVVYATLTHILTFKTPSTPVLVLEIIRKLTPMFPLVSRFLENKRFYSDGSQRRIETISSALEAVKFTFNEMVEADEDHNALGNLSKQIDAIRESGIITAISKCSKKYIQQIATSPQQVTEHQVTKMVCIVTLYELLQGKEAILPFIGQLPDFVDNDSDGLNNGGISLIATAHALPEMTQLFPFEKLKKLLPLQAIVSFWSADNEPGKRDYDETEIFHVTLILRSTWALANSSKNFLPFACCVTGKTGNTGKCLHHQVFVLKVIEKFFENSEKHSISSLRHLSAILLDIPKEDMGVLRSFRSFNKNKEGIPGIVATYKKLIGELRDGKLVSNIEQFLAMQD